MNVTKIYRAMRLLLLGAIILGTAAMCSDEHNASSASICQILRDGVEITILQVGNQATDVMLTINCDANWTLTKDAEADWLTLSNTMGEPREGGNTVRLSFAVNMSQAERQADVVLATNGMQKKLNITQQGNSDDSGWESAAAAVASMKTGWNLGNSLESFSNDETHSWIEDWTEGRPEDYETAWGQPVTTPKMIQKIKEGGFNAVRVPVTWFPHMDENDIVAEEWMARVQEVVDYVIDAGMYCILNVHHDTGADEVSTWLMADWNRIDEIESRFAKLWQQIAERFEPYDERLLFEGFNEMLDNQYRWETPADASSYDAINRLAQTFVNTVRATGGNNQYRNLVINTYSANHKDDALSHFVLPADPAYSGHLIASVHAYEPWDYAAGDPWTATEEAVIDGIMERLDRYFISQGIPAIIGEYEARGIEHASYYVGTARQYGVTCLHWMGLLNRAELTWDDPDLLEAITSAAQ